jgi:hypothetical protein
MRRFSPSEAALEGFRLTRERPLAVLVWALLRLLYAVIGGVVLTATGSIAVFTQLAAQPANQDPAQVQKTLGLIGQAAPAMLLLAAFGVVFYAVAYTAVLRAVLRPADRAFFYLRLSMDEVRQLGLALFVAAVFFLYVMAIELISIILIALAKALGPAALPVQILLVLGVLAAFVYPAVRLSLAPSLTFVDGRISLFRSFPLTKGQFWPLAGTYVLSLILAVVVAILGMVIFVLVVLALGSAEGGVASVPKVLQNLLQAQTMSLGDMATPLGAAKLVFGAALNTLGYVIMFSPAVAAFRSITGRLATPVAPVAATSGRPWG